MRGKGERMLQGTYTINSFKSTPSMRLMLFSMQVVVG
jgi:hypothetical protein